MKNNVSVWDPDPRPAGSTILNSLVSDTPPVCRSLHLHVARRCTCQSANCGDLRTSDKSQCMLQNQQHGHVHAQTVHRCTNCCGSRNVSRARPGTWPRTLPPLFPLPPPPPHPRTERAAREPQQLVGGEVGVAARCTSASSSRCATLSSSPPSPSSPHPSAGTPAQRRPTRCHRPGSEWRGEEPEQPRN